MRQDLTGLFSLRYGTRTGLRLAILKKSKCVHWLQPARLTVLDGEATRGVQQGVAAHYWAEPELHSQSPGGSLSCWSRESRKDNNMCIAAGYELCSIAQASERAHVAMCGCVSTGRRP